MIAEPRLLDHELLDQLEGRWRRQGAPIADALRPGIDSVLLDRVFATVGLMVPEEIRVWWTWHDGAERTSPRAKTMLGSGWSFLSADEALTELEEQRAAARSDDPNDPDDLWNPAWLPLSTNDSYAGVIVVDGTRDLTGPTPIFHTEPQMGGEADPPGAPSMGTLVQWWIDALDRGAAWNAAEQHWTYDTDDLDQELLKTALI